MQVPAVCWAPHLGQRQPTPAASVAVGRQQAGLLTPWRMEPAWDGHKVQQPRKSCSLLQSEQKVLGMHSQQWAAKPPFAGFICCCFCCILAQSHGIDGAQAMALTPRFCRQKYSPLTSSGPACVSHSSAVIQMSANTDVKPPSPPQTSPLFVSIFSLCIL